MTAIGWLQTLLFFGAILALTKPLGLYLTRVFTGERTWLSPVLVPVERLIYRLSGVREDEEMPWYTYAFAVLGFSAVGLLYLYIVLRTQKWLPFNPQHFDNVEPRSRLELGGQLFDQYELAVLFGRVDDELFHADGGSCVA